jgi:hypothetical protein
MQSVSTRFDPADRGKGNWDWNWNWVKGGLVCFLCVFVLLYPRVQNTCEKMK